MGARNQQVDEYIENAAPFARPILNHIRELMHKAEPGMEEAIKWGSPFFTYKGQIAMLAAFKEHAGLGFWKDKVMSDPHHLFGKKRESLGSLGKIRSLADLPPDDIIIQYIREAVELNEKGKQRPVKKTDFTKLETPAYFLDALKTNPEALRHYEAASPGFKKEYIQWFEEAKTEPTRQKRIATALEYISEGKPLNWKYMKK